LWTLNECWKLCERRSNAMWTVKECYVNSERTQNEQKNGKVERFRDSTVMSIDLIFFIHPHLRMLYRCRLSVCCFHFVFATPPELVWAFLWSLAQRKITLWRCPYCKGSPVQLFVKELWPLDLLFSLKLLSFCNSS
jgi:hypothetical protein